MPNFSANRYGSYSVTVPAYAINVRFSIAGASGGGSRSSTGGWDWSNGGSGRAGDFRLKSRTYDYTLTFHLGQQGGKGNGPALEGRGDGGSSAIASGGRGHRSGGGGGGDSGVYDGGLNRYVVIVGGGGGAGRYNLDTGVNGQYSGGRGIGGGGTTGNFSGQNGQNAAAGHRGGGGGGSNVGGSNMGGYQTTNGYAGIGGNSAWYNDSNYYDWTTNSGYANQGDGYYNLNFEYAPPTVQYFIVTPQQILQGDNAELSWSVQGVYNRININGDPVFTNVERQGTRDINPTIDTTYYLDVTGPGGSANVPVSIDVLVPPDVTLFSDAPNNTIVLGESVNLNWTITGDVSTAQMTPGVGEVNISGGPVTVSPTINTVYTLTASHPLAGQDSDQVEIIVLQPPTVSLSGPLSVDYGQNITVSIEATNATTSLQLLAIYHYEDNPGSSYEIVEEFGVAEQFNGQEELIVPYTDFGPNRIEYRLYAIGAGGLTDEADIEVDINIDRTPDALSVPEVADAIKNEDPVISPDQEVTSVQLVVDDIDVPVKIKADYPIQVEIDDDGVYRNVEEI